VFILDAEADHLAAEGSLGGGEDFDAGDVPQPQIEGFGHGRLQRGPGGRRQPFYEFLSLHASTPAAVFLAILLMIITAAKARFNFRFSAGLGQDPPITYHPLPITYDP
jgi:hypothetical protein